MNGHNNYKYEPFHIRISRSDFVAGIGTPTCKYVTLGGQVYVADTGRMFMQRIFTCQNLYTKGPYRLDNIMIQTGTI